MIDKIKFSGQDLIIYEHEYYNKRFVSSLSNLNNFYFMLEASKYQTFDGSYDNVIIFSANSNTSFNYKSFIISLSNNSINQTYRFAYDFRNILPYASIFENITFYYTADQKDYYTGLVVSYVSNGNQVDSSVNPPNEISSSPLIIIHLNHLFLHLQLPHIRHLKLLIHFQVLLLDLQVILFPLH
jgi:hypothetical protein